MVNCRASGAGSLLDGITVDDEKWQFDLNDDIADSRPDALMSMQGNATVTTIAVAGTPVKVAGTWVVEADSQMKGLADWLFKSYERWYPIVADTYDGTLSKANTSTDFSAANWHHALGEWASTSSRKAYLDGGGEGTNGDTRSVTGVDRASIGVTADL